MALGKSILNLFVEEESTVPPATPAKGEAQSAPVVSNTVSSRPTVAGPTAAEQQALDKKLQKLLVDAVVNAGISGYKAFEDILDSLEDILPEVNARYKKAMEILDKQGHDPVTLLNDIDKAIGVLESESRTFEQAQKSQFQESVGALSRAVENATSQIEAKQAQADALLKEVSDLKQKRVADQAAMATEQSKIDTVQGRFNVVYRALMAEIQEQRTIVATKAQVAS